MNLTATATGVHLRLQEPVPRVDLRLATPPSPPSAGRGPHSVYQSVRVMQLQMQSASSVRSAAPGVNRAGSGSVLRVCHRALRIAASAVTAAAEGDLNETARDRALTITAGAATAAAAAQIAGVANAPYNATINVTASGIGAVRTCRVRAYPCGHCHRAPTESPLGGGGPAGAPVKAGARLTET